MDLAQFNEQTKGKFTEYAFGQFVRQRRIELGISLKQLSAALDKTPPYISDIEKGKVMRYVMLELSTITA